MTLFFAHCVWGSRRRMLLKRASHISKGQSRVWQPRAVNAAFGHSLYGSYMVDGRWHISGRSGCWLDDGMLQALLALLLL